MTRKWCYILLGTSALCAATANAQTTDTQTRNTQTAPAQTRTTGLDEIVVTARKREETLQNVPVAVSAVSGDELRRSLASDMTKMAELAPQVSISQGGSVQIGRASCRERV